MDAKKEKQPAVRMARLLKDKLVPLMATQGVFGEGWQVEAVDAAPIGGLGEDHWASTTLSTTVQLVEKNSNCRKRSLALVSKCMLQGDGLAGYSNTSVMSENEVATYNKILPFLERLAEGTGLTITDLHPKCYFASCDIDPQLVSLTVMQDLRADGYRLAKERAALDKEHVMVALRAIGRFHAFSYAAKARCRKEFLETMMPLLREPVYNSPSWAARNRVSTLPALRGIDRAEERLEAAKNEVSDRHRRRVEGLARMRVLARNVYPTMKAAVSPEEPLAVLAHGDFCRNNMTFHHGPDGLPDAVCLFDFQTTRYCSPSVDLAFFLFLNTSAAMRAELWDDFFTEYFGCLKATLDRLLEGHSVDEHFVMPTLQDVYANFRRHAFMAYSICSFFLPQLMVRPEDMKSIDEMKELIGGDEDVALKYMVSIGGEESTETLADMVMEFLDRDLLP